MNQHAADPQDTVALVRCMLRLPDVPRWVVIPTIRKQSVAEHTLNAMALAMWLGARLGYHRAFTASVMTTLFQHDAYEAVTGDQPSPVKEKSGAHEPADATCLFAHAVDSLEAALFLRHEMELGNDAAMPVLEYVRARWHERFLKFLRAFSPSSDEQALLLVDEVYDEAMAQFALRRHPIHEVLGMRTGAGS